jgi:hypothetical protein
MLPVKVPASVDNEAHEAQGNLRLEAALVPEASSVNLRINPPGHFSIEATKIEYYTKRNFDTIKYRII